MRVALRLVPLMMVSGPSFMGLGCVLDNNSSAPDAAVYDVEDAGKTGGLRDGGGGCGNTGTSGTPATAGTSSGASGAGCGPSGTRPSGPLDASSVDAAPPCDEVVFSYDNIDASSVWITGDFTSWVATPAAGALQMTRTGSAWSRTARIGAGRHIYKLIVDASEPWIPDPGNPDSEDDGFGSRNSVITVCQ